MLELTIPKTDLWDERNQRFIPVKEQKLRLEHSLVSLSKWESKWCKVFLSKEQKTYEETIDYIRCMTLTQNVDPLVYQCITNSHIDAVNTYIEAPMTASTVKEEKGGPINRQQITSELIYYWMTAYHIPFECQNAYPDLQCGKQAPEEAEQTRFIQTSCGSKCRKQKEI